jgi:glutamate-1-semialdehyde 2,1-aminomutase
MTSALIAGISKDRLARMARREAERFAAARPRARAEAEARAGVFVQGVPMHWMTDWPLPFPLVMSKARDARLTDIDGFEIDDFCLGDTGSMFGHSPPAIARAIRRQAKNGLTAMLPTAAATRVGEALVARFGDYRWQIATTATDANRFALRVARAVTGRPKVLVFDGCYHGTVDDIFVTRDGRGRTVNRKGLLGQVADLSLVATAAVFNDLGSVARALAKGDVAAILTEPVMTNSAMVLPEPGFLEGLQDLARQHGALLILDETHTLSSGPGGYARVHGLAPDMVVVGKAVAGGMPVAVWGMTAEVEAGYLDANARRGQGHSGMGTTLSANPMQLACLEASLTEVMTGKAHARMDKGAARLERGLQEVVDRLALPWHVLRVGARVEFICAPGPLRNGAQARRAHQPRIEALMNLALLNRGCLIAPFHNMMLVSPVTTKRQIDRLIAAFAEVLGELCAQKDTAPG